MTANIYCWKDQIVYEAYHLSYFMSNGRDVTKIEKHDFIFVYKKDSTEGYFYDLFEAKPVQKRNVESFLRNEWYAQIKIYPIFLEAEFELLSSSKDKSSGMLQETFSLKGKGADSTKTGTITLFYSNDVKSHKISLSKELDSIKSMRLVKTRTVNNAREIKEYNFKLPRIETGYILEEIKEFNDKEIYKYFEGYKKKLD